MKKHLIAAAVAAAVAAPAMAQNVSLYGTIDAGIASISNMGTTTTGAGAATARLDATAFMDGTIASSVWGIRGSEDLGGGLRAVFDLQSDVQTNNGGMNQNGLFRRAAYVGVASSLGEVTFGVRINPLIATNGALMPVAGNLVSTNLATAMSFNDFFTKNAVTYVSPNLGGLVITGQYGFENSLTANQQGGNVIAGSAVYTVGGFTFRAAMQDRKDNGVASSANSSMPTANALNGSLQHSVANANLPDGTVTRPAAFDTRTYLAGISYATGPWTLAVAMMNSREATATDGAKTERAGTQMGIGYRMSPAVLLGASYSKAEGSTFSNVQARYSLSKRTTGYVGYGVSDNGPAGRVAFMPWVANTGTLPTQVITDMNGGVHNLRSTAVGGGLIHTF